MGKYTIGIDFGTLSARCVLVNVADGKEIAVSVCGYRHGVMDEKLPSGKALPPGGFALQEPQDYVEALQTTIREVIEKGPDPAGGDLCGRGGFYLLYDAACKGGRNASVRDGALS